MAARGSMAIREVTIQLPVDVYEQIQRAAASAHRSMDDVLTEAVIAAAPTVEQTPTSLRSALAHMVYLNDAALWQAARATVAPGQRERLAVLHDRQQAGRLTDEERAEERALLALYRETVLVRAQAAALLKQRGYGVDNLDQFEPLE